MIEKSYTNRWVDDGSVSFKAVSNRYLLKQED